jgi:hypothetical protein
MTNQIKTNKVSVEISLRTGAIVLIVFGGMCLFLGALFLALMKQYGLAGAWMFGAASYAIIVTIIMGIWEANT